MFEPALPNLALETELWQHYKGGPTDYALAFDEAGRGPLFGPVTIGAFLITTATFTQLPQLATLWKLTDSKKMSAKQRSHAFDELQQLEWGQARHVAVRYIEKYNINGAIEHGIRRLVKIFWQRYQTPPLFLLVDGNYRFHFEIPFHTRVRGDRHCLSLAAASVIAKVSRDNLIHTTAKRYAQYGIAKHKGYGTTRHIEAIRRFGPSKHHRNSFLKNLLKN